MIFVRGADNRLWEARSSDGGATNSAWRDLEGVLLTAPVATSFRNEVHLVTQGADAAIYRQNTRP